MSHDSILFYSVIRDMTPSYMWHGSRTNAHFTVIWCCRLEWMIHVACLSLPYNFLFKKWLPCNTLHSNHDLFRKRKTVAWLTRNTVTFRVGAISFVTWLCVRERVVCLVCVWQSRVCILCCVRLCVPQWCDFMCDMMLSCVSWPIHVSLTRVNGMTFEK